MKTISSNDADIYYGDRNRGSHLPLSCSFHPETHPRGLGSNNSPNHICCPTLTSPTITSHFPNTAHSADVVFDEILRLQDISSNLLTSRENYIPQINTVLIPEQVVPPPTKGTSKTRILLISYLAESLQTSLVAIQ
jgi:hypothetical protein